MQVGDDSDQGLPKIEGYRIEAVIGRGGMAVVYRARQCSLDRVVAIKVMARREDDDDAGAERFAHEAKVIAGLEHPGIVGIHDVGRLADGRLFYAMPFLPGGDLSARDLSGDERSIIDILRVLLGALGHAHARGVVHRDVKPENVLFDGAGQPRLADFGIALGGRRATSRITREGMTLGSGGYMAPEQARGERLDGRADLYGVGVLAYELLVGALPFKAADELSQALMHAQDPVPRLPDGLAHWQGFIDRAMAKHPSQRYPDADAMLHALDRVDDALRHPEGVRRMAASAHVLQRPWVRWGLPGLIVCVLLAVAWRASSPSSVEKIDLSDAASVDDIDQRLSKAEREIQAGAWVVPAGNNAAETYLSILRDQPGRADAMNGLRRVFAGLARQAQEAVELGDDGSLQERLAQADVLANGLGALGDEGRAQVREAATQALDAAMLQAITAMDAARREGILARYATHGLDASTAKALLIPMPDAPAAPSPPAVTSPTAGRPISVADYRRFVEATQRPDSRCRARLSPLRLVEARTWRDPGFPQSDSSPVVCVSHADAVAYAQWLSRQSGRSWRLPDIAQQRAQSVARVVDEWSRDCARGNASSCQRQQTFTRSATEVGRDPSRGYDEVGFRLLRGE